jgi:hypothetical protein
MGGLNLRSAGRDFEIFEVGLGIASPTAMVWTRGCDGWIQGVKLHLVANGQGVPLGVGVGDGGG